MLTYILFVLGFVVLVKGADLMVEGAASIARKMGVSMLVIGLTIVAFGTSAPELAVNIFASLSGNTDIAIGNILGSNIANVLLILGLSGAICPLVAKKNTIFKEIPLAILACILLGIMVHDHWIDGAQFSGLTRTDGMILLSFFAIFLYYVFEISKADNNSKEKTRTFSYSRSFIYCVLGSLGLFFGGKWIVDGAVVIATNFNMSQSLIGLTIVAIGTSLPELATSVVAAYKKQTDIAVGNAVGSTIFNIFWILGLSAIISPLPFRENFSSDVIISILAGVILFLAVLFGRPRVVDRKEGIFMVLLYFLYLAYTIYTK